MVPAMRVFRPSVGKRVMARMPDSPAVSLAQLSVLPAPSEVTTPRPVTTTIGRPILSFVDDICALPQPTRSTKARASPRQCPTLVTMTCSNKPWLKSPLIGRSSPVESQGGNRLPCPTATAEEREFLSQHGDLAVRATGSYLGHGLEPQFPMNVALAAVAVGQGRLFPPCDSTGLERPMNGDLNQVLVTGVGHWRGEALALVERVG